MRSGGRGQPGDMRKVEVAGLEKQEGRNYSDRRSSE